MKIKILISIILVMFLNSCIQDTITKFETFTVQVPVFFKSDHIDKASPDTSIDFTNLYEYKEYNDNKGRIDAAEIFQINYRIDSLVLENGKVFDPKTDNLEFEYISFRLKFAKPKAGKSEFSTDSLDFEPDNSTPLYILGEFKNVKVQEYYRAANHIIQIPEENARAISDMLKKRPYFYIYTEYSRTKGQQTPVVIFPFLRAKYDVIIRLRIKL